MAQSGVISESVPGAGSLRSAASWFSAILLAAIFLLAGLWKLTDPHGAGVRLAEARVPESLSVAAAIGLGILETFAGLIVLRPRWRRWGAALSGFLLLAFMVFIAMHYRELR
ncbi:MAG TPA: MauE/DoxX family redox-associated membrane protein, partial [Bryobacteraceae bacterium]|nr:MauE/DoxX family redox-associated membrane protein [Bryobacteraceae bacterium]